MTEEEHRLVQEMHDALMKPRATGEPPLIEQLGEMTRAYGRAKWLTKMCFLGLPAVGAAVAAWQTISTFWAEK